MVAAELPIDDNASGEDEYLHPKRSRMASQCEGWKMPFTLENWRWGLQEALTIALLMWPSCVPAIDQKIFNGNCRWVVASATPVIEGTAGGTTRRMIDRVIGTCIAGILVITLFTMTIGVHSERSDKWYCLLILYILISLCGFIYNWLLFVVPTHPLIAITAAFMTPIILGGSIYTGAAVVTASWRLITVLFGVLVSGSITRYFLPRRARVDIIVGLSQIIEELADSLEPLIELESGMVVDGNFFRGNVGGFVENLESQQDLGQIDVSISNWNSFKQIIWKRLERCGKLTNDQLVMVNAARTEISMRRKNAFFQEEHTQALMNIRTLFYHVTSLYFLIDTQISGNAHFEDESLLEEISHWSRFGLVNIQGGGPPIRRPSASTPNLGLNAQVTPDMASQHHHTSTGSLPAEEFLVASVNPTARWARVYGPTVGLMVRHICAALKATASGLRDNHYPIEAEVSLRKAADAIALFHRQRAERQQATATFVEYAIHGATSAEEDPEFLARFEEMLGLPVCDYDGLSEEGRLSFWQSYWLLRDRLSTSDTNVMTLFVAVRTATNSVSKLIKARRNKLIQGEELRDNMDVDTIDIQKQAALCKAGANINRTTRL